MSGDLFWSKALSIRFGTYGGDCFKRRSHFGAHDSEEVGQEGRHEFAFRSVREILEQCDEGLGELENAAVCGRSDPHGWIGR
jgi:hypothetical protein